MEVEFLGQNPRIERLRINEISDFESVIIIEDFFEFIRRM